MRILYLSTNFGLNIRIYPARHIKPLLGKTVYFSSSESNFLSKDHPPKPEGDKISVATLNFFAIAIPPACALFEMTTRASTPTSLRVFIACSIERKLLPLPDIKIASLNTLEISDFRHKRVMFYRSRLQRCLYLFFFY